MRFDFVENDKAAKIKVIGIGGAGGNAVNNMIQAKLQGVKFIAANTDAQVLDISKAPVKIQLGERLTEGLGAGADPQVGCDAAKENVDEIRSVLENGHMVFITAGLGGGTGTGAAPVVAEVSKGLGALTVAVVTKPFAFEGRKRMQQAEEGIKQLKDIVDTLIVIPNDRLLGLASKNTTLVEMFKRADEVLLHSVKGITDLIMNPGLVNLDFADVRSTMSKSGLALMGTGIGCGENRSIEAAEKAISHPLLENISISGASGILMNITCGSDLTMAEMTEASDRIYKEAGEDAEIIWGTVLDDSIGDELRVTVIATGIEAKRKETTRGRLRPVTPEDINRSVNYDEPTFIRYKKAVGDETEPSYKVPTGLIMDSNDLEVPTFMRRRVD
ncbi:MAG: cell division protein FtsZ [Deltaproteobacteria bacterium]|nr:cell division protein FtsZ [Deltaproteobacteria bacterium]